MNHILLTQEDFIHSDQVCLNGPRAEHIVKQLKATLGSCIKLGLLGGHCGYGIVKCIDAAGVVLRVELGHRPPAPSPVKLVLALPRPKVFKRVIRSVVELGVKEIHLINTWKVDKSYWQTPLLNEESLAKTFSLGLSIAKDTIAPKLKIHKRFKPFVEDDLPIMVGSDKAFIAHPSQNIFPSQVNTATWLAIGPEGGFTEYEATLFNANGFSSVSLGERILRVETAVSAAIGRLNPI